MDCQKTKPQLPEEDFLDKVRKHKIKRRSNMKAKAYSYNLCHILPTIFEYDDLRKKYQSSSHEATSFEITCRELLDKKKNMEKSLVTLEKNFGTLELFLIKKLSRYQKDISYVLINDTKKLSLESTRQRKTEKRATELLKSMVGKKNEIIETLIRRNIRLVLDIIKKSETVSKLRTAKTINNDKSVEMELMEELKEKLKTAKTINNDKSVEMELMEELKEKLKTKGGRISPPNTNLQIKNSSSKDSKKPNGNERTKAVAGGKENNSYKKGLDHFKTLEAQKQKLNGPMQQLLQKKTNGDKSRGGKPNNKQDDFTAAEAAREEESSFKNPWCPTCKERMPLKNRYIECEECGNVVHPEFTDLPPCCVTSLEISIGIVECTACSKLDKENIMCRTSIDDNEELSSQDTTQSESRLPPEEETIHGDDMTKVAIYNNTGTKISDVSCKKGAELFNGNTDIAPPKRTSSIKRSNRNASKSCSNSLSEPGIKQPINGVENDDAEPPRCYSPNSNDKEFNKISDHFLRLRISLDSPIKQLEENLKNLQGFIQEVGFIQENIIDRLVIDRYMIYSEDDSTQLQEKRVNTFIYTIDFKDDMIGKLRAKHVELLKKFDALVEELVTKSEVDFNLTTRL